VGDRIRAVRLGFWLRVIDVAHWLGVPQSVYLWMVGRAANCINYKPLEESEDKPW
jgi:hypothetical protein